MCAFTVLKAARCQGCAGRGDRAGESSVAKKLARLPSSFWSLRSFSAGNSAAMAASAARTSTNTVWRSRARIQWATTCTELSAVALSLGEYGRADQAEVLGDDALGDGQAARDRLVREPAAVLESANDP